MSTSVEILTVNGRNDRAWDDIVAGIGQHDVYFLKIMSQAFAEHEGHAAHMFCMRRGESVIIYPFLLRRIASLSFLQSPEAWNEYYDATSPYGYGGPLVKIADVSERDTQQLWADFLEAYHAYCVDRKIVCEFARLHPFLKNHLHLSEGLERRGSVVTIDLQQSDEAIWQGFTKENRKKIGRAQIRGLRVEQVDTPTGIRLFAKLYDQTMRRVQAHNWYFFSEDWLTEFHARLAEHLTLFLVYDGDNVVAGASVFHANGLVNNFLSASDSDSAQLAPNNLMFYEVIRWAKRRGYRWYNLGGGYRPDDGVMRFKMNYSQHTADFYTYQKIHLPDAYECLVQEWRHAAPPTNKEQGSAFFPLYRMAL
jgi:Acetyltransferase (GNAT) domain